MNADTTKKLMLALAIVPAIAIGQSPPPQGAAGPRQGGDRGFGGPPQGGPGGPGAQFGPPGGMMMRGPGPAGILLRPDVKKELKLTDDQTKRIADVLQGEGGRFGAPGGGQGGFGGPLQGGPLRGGPPGQRGQGGFGGPPQGGPPQGGFGGPPQGGPPNMDPQQMHAREQELDKKIKATLNDSQFVRYHELSLQMEGPQALGKKDVADKVGIGAEKREKIAEIARKAMESMRSGPGGPPQGGPPNRAGNDGSPQGNFDDMRQRMEDMRSRMEKSRKEAGDKILALLTDGERQKWNSLLGKPFKFEAVGPPPGGPGGFGGN